MMNLTYLIIITTFICIYNYNNNKTYSIIDKKNLLYNIPEHASDKNYILYYNNNAKSKATREIRITYYIQSFLFSKRFKRVCNL